MNAVPRHGRVFRVSVCFHPKTMHPRRADTYFCAGTIYRSRMDTYFCAGTMSLRHVDTYFCAELMYPWISDTLCEPGNMYPAAVETYFCAENRCFLNRNECWIDKSAHGLVGFPHSRGRCASSFPRRRESSFARRHHVRPLGPRLRGDDD